MNDYPQEEAVRMPEALPITMDLVHQIRKEAEKLKKQLDVVIISYPTAPASEKITQDCSPLVNELKSTLEFIKSISNGLNI